MVQLVKDYVGSQPFGSVGSPLVPARPAWVERVCATSVNIVPVVPPVLSGGYGQQLNGYGTLFQINGNMFQGVTVTTCVLVQHPATSEIPAIPPTPPTSAQLSVWRNDGWNTVSNSIGTLDPGYGLSLNSPFGTRGIILYVGFRSGGVLPTDTGVQGLVLDSTGAYPINALTDPTIANLTTSNFSVGPIKLIRHTNGQLSAVVGGDIFFNFPQTLISTAVPLYVYVMLYSAGDSVANPAFASMNMQIASATLVGTGTLTAGSLSKAVFAGIGQLKASAHTSTLFSGTSSLVGSGALVLQAQTNMAGVSSLYAEALTGGRSSSQLPYVGSIGGDYGFGAGLGTLPAIVCSATGGVFVPQELIVAYCTLPLMVGDAYGSDSDFAEMVSPVPTMSSIGADYAYGVSSVSLPGINSVGAQSAFPDRLMLFSGAVTTDTLVPFGDLVLILNSSGLVTSSFIASRDVSLSLNSILTGHSYDPHILGVLKLALVATARGVSLQVMNANNKPDLISNGVVWVVNLANKASTQYEQYGFNSFFERAGIFYGVANDGIYELDGATDAGELISALLVTEKSDLDTKYNNRIENVYMGISSTDKMILRVDVDGVVNYYTARDSSQNMKNHRVDLGRGLFGSDWQFTLINNAGCDFNLSSIEFTPIELSRSI